MINELQKYGKAKENVDLTKYNTYKVPATSKYFVDVFDEKSLVDLINYLKENNVDYYVVGNGSNIIFPQNEFSGVVIKLSELNKIDIDDD